MSRRFLRSFAVLFATLGGLLAAAPAQAVPMTACLPDWNAMPYVSDNPLRPGLVERLLLESAKSVGVELEITRLSPLRCLRAMELGTVHVAPLTARAVNLGLAEMPMRGGQLDPSRRLMSVPLVVVRRSGDERVQWDGRRFLPANAVGGVRHGLHVYRDLLAPYGVPLDEGATTGEQLLRKLGAGRMDFVLMSRGEFELLQASTPKPVEALPRLFTVVEYYLALSRHHSADHRKVIEAWWEAMARLREQAPYTTL